MWTIREEDLSYTDEKGEQRWDEDLVLAVLLREEVVFSNGRRYWQEEWESDPANPGQLRDSGTQTEAPWKPETTVLFVLCSDVFYWGCADAESLLHREIILLYEEWRRDSVWGAARWCCRRRKMRPQLPVEERMREVGAWTDELKALPKR